MMGDYVSNVGNDNTDVDVSPNMQNISHISFRDSLDEEPISVTPKVRSTFTGRSYAGEELQKVLGNDANLNTYVSGSVQDVLETERPRHPGLPIAPILKYYEIIGPPRISLEEQSLNDHRTQNKAICESESWSPTKVRQIYKNEALSLSSRNFRQSRRMPTLESLPELDQTPEEDELAMVPFTSTPIMDKSSTLTMLVGIRLLGMSLD